MAFETTKIKINSYISGKRWYWYVPLWVIAVYCFWQLLGFNPDKQLPLILLIPQSFDFMLHEVTHILLAFAPPILTATAGSFSELLLGSLLVWGAFKTRCYFASMICCLWFMLTCQSAGTYMADARAQTMDLVSLGGALSGSDKVIHDWNFVFGELHLLRFDTFIGNSVRGIGIIAGLFGIVFGAWLMYIMAAQQHRGAMQKSINYKEAQLLHQSAHEAGLFAAPVEHFIAVKENKLYPTPIQGSAAEPVSPPKEKHF